MSMPNDTLHVTVEYFTGTEEGADDVGHPYYVASCQEIVAVTDGETWGDLMRSLQAMLNAFLDGQDTATLYDLVPNPRIIITMQLPENYGAIASAEERRLIETARRAANTPDPNYLKNDQYKNSTRLSARARLHSQYSRNPHGWFAWMFDLYDAIPPQARILELGAGAGWLWAGNAARIPAGWEITLSDFSIGMLDDARKTLADVPHGFGFEEIDAQAIPYPDAAFDAVIANHMLYHVPDRAKAIAEMRRVLKPGGTLFTATNGEKHLQEVHQLMRRFGFQPQEWLGGFVERGGYTLENAEDQLRAQFPNVEVRRYDDAIRLTDAEPLVDYILSYPVKMIDERIAELRAFVADEIARRGVFAITKDMGVAIARG